MERRRKRRKRGIGGTAVIQKGILGFLRMSPGDEDACQVLDLSEEGVCLLSRNAESDLAPNKRISFRVKTPRFLEFKASGRIAWVKPWVTGGKISRILGVEFESLDDATRSAIAAALQPPPARAR